MSDETLQDDQSHYEISLTGGQAFVAFVLLLLSLTASFAFGLLIGKGQADSRLVVQREPSIVTEASALGKPRQGDIVELVPERRAEPETTAPVDEATSTAPVLIEEAAAPDPTASTAAPAPAEAGATPPASRPEDASQAVPDARPAPERAPAVPHYAQLLSTGDQKTAESLAARLIDNGFTSAYVERGSNEKGQIFRVRVKFSTEGEARAAEARLKTFSKDVWITK